MKPITLTINDRTVQALVEPRTHLGDFLRDQQRLTGTHLGCEHGVCGACTVLLDGQPVRSCITYAVACDGREVRTIEGFEDDALMNRLREAFSREHALQCGFCTPGMLIASRDICGRLPGADEQRIRVELSGNLCRCTGYVGIVNAVKSVAAQAASAEASPQFAAAQTGPSTARPTPRATPLRAFEPAAVTASAAVARNDASAATAAVGRNDASAATTAPAATGVEPDRKGWSRIEERFTVAHTPAAVWQVLSDLPAAAACLPGAELTEHDERTAKGRIKIKFGPMSAAFAGAAGLERDDAQMRAVIRGAGTDSVSSSRARGDIAYRLVPEQDGRATRVEVTLDYSLVGPLAQFSRSGLVKDFASRLIAEFARNLNARIGAPQATVQPAAELRAGAMFWSIVWARIKRLFGF